MNNVELAVQFFLQIAVILAACRLVGMVAARFGQPQVVAEMITGVMLGPSLFGLLAPEWQAEIFPWDPTQKSRDSQSYLFPASQLGLALYMFVVGLEFRTDIIRDNFRSSIAISLAGMLAPFVLGAGLGWLLFETTELFPEKTSLAEAMLFLGASMCITAFPMLARIIHFKGLAGTKMGTVAIGAGAIDDVAAWCVLAVVRASFDDRPSAALINIGLGIGFVLVATLILKPALKFVSKWLIKEGELSDAGAVVGLGCMALGCWLTDSIGLHAVFGAFVIGACIPKGTFSEKLTAHVEPLTVTLLLPLFFTYSGLNTRITLLNTWYLWGVCGLVLLAAVLGKGVACALAARATGMSTRDSLGVGTLMNARGLMELIIINIGLQRGIISPGLFATLVVMAVLTTLVASPVFDLVMSRRESEPMLGSPDAEPISPAA